MGYDGVPLDMLREESSHFSEVWGNLAWDLKDAEDAGDKDMARKINNRMLSIDEALDEIDTAIKRGEA